MTAEWLAALIAVVAAFIAAGGAIVAYSQAISARRQADAAVEQVASARRAAKSAEDQAAEAKRANDHASLQTSARAIGALNSYAAALGAMTQTLVARLQKRERQDYDFRFRVTAAQQGRADVIAALAANDQVKEWIALEAEFDVIMLFIADLEEDGVTKDASLIRLSIRKPPPESIEEALARANDVWQALFRLHSYIEGRFH